MKRCFSAGIVPAGNAIGGSVDCDLGFAGADECLSIIRYKHPIIDEIESTGLTTLSDGTRVPVQAMLDRKVGK